MININPKDSQPIYEQIIEQYKLLVFKKFLKPGDAILSVRRLALELNITPGTVAKAYQEMERMGVIETIRGKGTFIAESKTVEPTENDINLIESQLRKPLMQLCYFGLGKKEIMQRVETIVDSICKEGK
jgi:GntR family transcriptional regulator